MNTEYFRQQTWGCTKSLFLNSAGASLMPHSVVTAMTDYLQQEELLGGYEVERQQQSNLQRLYTELAKLLNAKPGNVAFAWNGTDAYNRALSAIAFQRGDVILTTADDYISNQIAFLALQKRFGVVLVRAVNLPTGDLDLSDFEAKLRLHRPVLVAVTHVPTNSGLVQSIEEIGRLCKSLDTWYLVDACQSVGQIPLDVERIGCDFLAATGRKFLRGPRGAGFLYVSDRALQAGLEPLFVDRRGADWTGADTYRPRPDGLRFEQQELAAPVVGLAEAVRWANAIGVDHIAAYNATLTSRLRQGLAQLDNLRALDRGSVLCNLVTFHAPGYSLEEITTWLTGNNVVYTVSLSSYALIDFTAKGVDWAIRLSPHYFNTLTEIEQALDLLSQIKPKKSISHRSLVG